MDYMKIEEAAAKWGLSVRRTQDLCKLGRVPGAKRFGTNWMIPAQAERPADGRRKGAAVSSEPAMMIRNAPFLIMTDLYQTPGTAQACLQALAHQEEAQKLFAAELAYSRGQIDEVYAQAQAFLGNHDSLYGTIAGGMLMGLVAMWKGDVNLWHRAKLHLYEAPWQTDNHRDIISLSNAATDLSIRNTKEFPDWFYRGQFEHLPPEAHPAAWVYYVKKLLISAQEVAAGRLEMQGISGLGLMGAIPFVAEPLVAQAVVEKTLLAEIYLRLLCAVAYHQVGEESLAALHLDRAIGLCLPDGLYGPLVEYRRQLGLFLDERLLLADSEAARRVKELHKQLHEGWVRLHNAVMENNINAKLSDREREVARLAAFGLSDEQIAERLHITRSSVKSMLHMARNKTGIKDRTEFGAYI